jgi:hypothetical protein
MTAADLLERAHRRAFLLHAVLVPLVALVVLVIAFVVVAHHERAAGAREARVALMDSLHRAALVDTIRVVDVRITHDTVRIAQDAIRLARAEKKSAVAIAREDTTAKVIAAIADTSTVVSASIANLEVQQCHDMRDDLLDEIDTLKVTIADVKIDRDDVTISRDAWKARALLDEATAKPPPRFGFQSGFVAGVTTTAFAVLSLLLLAK